MWPTNEINPFIYWVYTLLVLILFEIPIAILPFANLFIKEDVGVLEIANGIFLNLQVFVVPFKMAFLLIHHKNLRKAFEVVCNGSFSSYIQPEHYFIVQDGAKSTNKAFNYISLCLVTGILMTSSPLLNIKEKPWLVEMWLPIDIKASWLNYITVYVYTLIGK